MFSSRNRKTSQPYLKQSATWPRLLLLLCSEGLLALLAWLSIYSNVKVDWGKAKDVSDVFKNYAEAVAIVGGAIWAFFKFRKGRTYKETLGAENFWQNYSHFREELFADYRAGKEYRLLICKD